MKETKFRAWVDGKMIYLGGDEYISFFDSPGAVDWMISSRVDGRAIYKHDPSYPEMYEANNLMQYTGLKDKNGKEIYESDIVKVRADGYYGGAVDSEDVVNIDRTYTGQVVITASKGAVMRRPKYYDHNTGETVKCDYYVHFAQYRTEVIGNIYENPEFLNS